MGRGRSLGDTHFDVPTGEKLVFDLDGKFSVWEERFENVDELSGRLTMRNSSEIFDYQQR